MNRDDIPIDPDTGLAQLPKNQFFRVEAEKRSDGSVRNYQIILVEKVTRQVEGWFGNPKEIIESLNGLYRMVITHYENGLYAGFATELTEEDIKLASLDILIAIEQDKEQRARELQGEKRSKSLLGDYPPRSIK